MRVFHALLLLLLGMVLPSPASAQARICIDPDVFNFGNIQIGNSTSANWSVSNCGTASWSFTDVSVHPATGPAFSVSSSCSTGMVLAPGDRCNVAVTFAPQVTGQTSGGLWLRNTADAPDAILTFYGRGVDAQSGTAMLQFIPQVADFGTQTLGTRSDAMDLELYNQGPAAMSLSAIVLNGPQAFDFLGFDNGCLVGSVIPAGQGCHMVLYFAPQAAGTRLANLVVDSPQLASLAILQIVGVGSASAPASVPVIEFYNGALDHYFMTSIQTEIDALDNGLIPGWVRTGRSFNAYAQPAAGTNPVCRYYMPPPLNSHFYSASADECAEVASRFPWFISESPAVFYIALPNEITGECPQSAVPVYRLYNNRPDANHRYTTDPALKAQMQAQGYIAEGYGPDAVIMCAAR
ncbi:MAG TPA: choice-of-anchor D domain-containing protein [Casimicrobiaceae bacterium]|nr:choice-of-anchor D domain-containing protein [Casimicrobiaceae bacterium]